MAALEKILYLLEEMHAWLLDNKKGQDAITTSQIYNGKYLCALSYSHCCLHTS